MKLAENLLLKLGLATDVVQKLLSSDENVTKDVKIDEVFLSVQRTVKKKLEDDGTINDLVEEGVKNKLGPILGVRDKNIRKELKARGIDITDEEYNKLPEKERTDELIRLALKRVEEKKGGNADEKDKEILQLRNDLQKLADEKEKLEKEELPKLQKEADEKINSFKRSATFNTSYFENLKGKLISDEAALKPAVEADFFSKYDLGEKDGKTVLYKKGTQTIAFHDNSNKEITLVDALNASAAPFLKKQDPPGDKKRIIEPNPDGKVNSRTAKIQQNLERVNGSDE